jgi:hypothetical protein
MRPRPCSAQCPVASPVRFHTRPRDRGSASSDLSATGVPLFDGQFFGSSIRRLLINQSLDVLSLIRRASYLYEF